MMHLNSDVLILARTDRARYLAALAAPIQVRPALLALLAFDAEIARIPKMVSEPMLGRIRLQWWIDVLPDLARGHPPGHPVALALAPLGVETKLLCALVTAQSFVWDGDATNGEDVLAYAQSTGGAVQALWMEQLGVEDVEALSIARDIGAAWVLLNLDHFEAADQLLSAARARFVSKAVKKMAFPAFVLARLVDRRLRLGGGANEGAGAVMSVWWGQVCGRF